MTPYRPNPKTIKWESKKYLDHVRSFPCAVCGFPDTEAHHIRWSFNSGTGTKPSDTWAIPLCHKHHMDWHTMGFKSFQKQYDVDIYRELFLIAKNWIEKC